MRFMIMAFSLCVILTGCYYKPITYKRPWSRFLSQTEIEKGSTLKVVVKCESSPLIGDESLILQEIKDTASNLLRSLNSIQNWLILQSVYGQAMIKDAKKEIWC